MVYGKALDCLSDPTRRRVFERLRSGPKSVGVLARGMPVSRPAVSQHLRVLKEAGLVSDTRAGTRRLYQLNPEGIALLRAHFDQMWGQAMNSFASTVEARKGKER